jgi:hypothetical protein
MKRCVLAFSVGLAFSASAGNVFTLRNGIKDWTRPESYDQNAVPEEGDQVELPADCTVMLDSSDTASWKKAELLDRIIPADATSRLIVNVGSDDAKLTVPFSASNVKDVDYDKGVLEKTGSGNLVLGGSTARFKASGDRYDYYTGIVVSEGTLTLPQDVAEGGAHRYGRVTIAESATLVNIAVGLSGIYPSATLSGISGRGTITSSGSRPLQIVGTSTFEGKFSGCLNVYANGIMTLLGNESDTTGTVTVRLNYGNFLASIASGGILYVTNFGVKGSASSIGAGGTVKIGSYGGGFVYLGTGETCDKDLNLADEVNMSGASFIHGGDHGRLNWTGKWMQSSGDKTYTKAHRLFLMGNHANECIMSGAMTDAASDGILFPITIIKRDNGTWRMAHNDDRTGGGTYVVEAGTLAYDSIAEKGSPCALGASNNLLNHGYSGRDLENNRVPHAFLLGSENNTTATMEFTGSNGGICSTRPVAVKGKGRFKISGQGAYSFRGFYATNAANSELVLDTDRTDGYVSVGDISDGDVPLSVTKEGDGEIKVTGYMTSTGPLSVKEGTLTLCTTNRPYTWFRWIVKEKGYHCSRYADIASSADNLPVDLKMEEFALFDVDGMRIDKGISYYGSTTDHHLMPNGSIAEEDNWFYQIRKDSGSDILESSKLESFFDGKAGSSSGVWGGINIRSQKSPFCKLDTPSYWFKFIERLPENSKAAASFDLAFFFGSETSDKGKVSEAVTAVAIEGSVDGINWELAAENNSLKIPADKARWYANPSGDLVSVSGASYTLKEHVGFPMRGYCTNGVSSVSMPVSVAQGATLKAIGDMALSSLVLSKDGNGTIDGFTFDDGGAISVEVGSSFSGRLEIPVQFVNCSNMKNLEKWTLSIDGGSSRGRKLRVQNDGTVAVEPPGMVVILK